jgi:WD40 repeat protein
MSSPADDGGAAPDPAIQLEWVLGVKPTAVHVVGPSLSPAHGPNAMRVVYMSGNVGIIYDTGAKTQTLLRGHVSAGGRRRPRASARRGIMDGSVRSAAFVVSSLRAPVRAPPSRRARAHPSPSPFPCRPLPLQRNPLRACVVTPDRAVIVTACAGAESSIIFWDSVTGQPVAMIESPHAGGTAAMDFSGDGLYLVTLSVPRPGADDGAGAGSSPSSLVQELAVWDCRSVLAPSLVPTLGADPSADPDAAPTPRIVASAVVPVSEEQASLTVSPRPLPLPVGTLREPPTAGTGQGAGVLSGGFEAVTTGQHSVVFWVATCIAVKDDEAGAVLRKQARERGTGKPTPAELAAIVQAARKATKDVWHLVCDAPSVPKMLSHGAIDKSTGRPIPPAPRPLRSSVFLPGHFAANLHSVDEIVIDLQGVGTLQAGSTTTIVGAGSTTGAIPPGGAGATAGGGLGAAKALRNKELLIPPTGSSVVAASGCVDGTLLLWRLSAVPPHDPAFVPGPRHTVPDAANNFTYATVGDAAAQLARKSCLKVLKLTLPESAGGAAPHAPGAPVPLSSTSALNVLLPTPGGKHLVVGTADGAVRVYDLNMRLVGWFEGLGSGAVNSLSFIPGSGGPGAYPPKGYHTHYHHHYHEHAHVVGGHVTGAAGTAIPAHLHTLSSVVPDLVLATARSLILTVSMASFDANDEAGTRGTVILEGPDGAVTSLAAYPTSATLALAVASGCIQLWDTTTKTLLLVRELKRSEDGLAIPTAPGAPPPPVLPPFYTPTVLSVDPRSRFIGVGTTEGVTFILDPSDLSDVQPPLAHPHWPRTPTSGISIARLAFSEDGFHMATADSGRHVALYRYTRRVERRVAPGAENMNSTARMNSRRPWETLTDDADRYENATIDGWTYIGRVQSHNGAITGLAFSPLPASASARGDTGTGHVAGHSGATFWAPGAIVGDAAISARHDSAGLCQLASVGADRRLVLYDVGSSSVAGGFQLRGARTRIEQFATPTACIFEPPGAGDAFTRVAMAGAAAAAADGDDGDGALRGADGSSSSAAAAAPLLLVATDAFKFKQWVAGGAAAAGNPQAGASCVRTLIAPTFGGNVVHLAYLSSTASAPSSAAASGSLEGKEGKDGEGGSASAPAAGGRRFFAIAYATSDRVIGIVGCPLNGNPYAVAGVVGHTGPVAGMAASYDGSALFTAGQDAAPPSGSTPGAADAAASAAGSVCIWKVSEAALASSVASGGAGMTPFLSLLEGGAGGEQYASVCDFFAYGQIHAGGEGSTAPRRAGITLPVAELASVMRALGFFPTAEELASLVTEARLSAAAGGEDVESVDLSTVVRLFVNHRPVGGRAGAGAGEGSGSGSGSLRDRVSDALRIIMAHPSADGETDGQGFIRWGGLKEILGAAGEALGPHEAEECLKALLRGGDAGAGAADGEALIDDDELVSGEDLADRILQV